MSHSKRWAAGALACLCAAAVPARAQVTVTVDLGADNHTISPLVYGMNFATAAQVRAGRIPLSRWGGNSTSRYNYQIDVTNTGADYYFENIPGCWGAADNYCQNPPKDPQAQSGANAFLDAAAAGGVTALLTVPTIGWVAKAPPVYAHPFVCGCPRSALAQQDSFDPYDSGCGNGKQNGAWLTCPAPTTTSTAVDASFTRAWVAYLTNRLGPSNGKRIYALDNEPNLWSSTHHDVHPAALGYDELWQRMRDNAAAILDADPTALVAGPAEWGWPNYFCSDADNIQNGCSAASPDRAAHGGVELTAWLLDQAAAYERQNHVRLLHYLDLHYYPMGGNPPENTRSLWDPTYRDPSWINDTIRMVPRMRDWAAQHYPGTRLLISEYDFGRHGDATGAITYAEVLGIFGREGLDAATAWAPPAENEAAFGAYQLFLNYDGAGGHFQAESARATTSGRGVAAFASYGPSQATVVLVNEGGRPLTLAVTLDHFTPQGAALFYAGTGVNLARQADAAPAGNTYSVTLPGTSFGILAAPGIGPMSPPPADMTVGPGDAATAPRDAAAAGGGGDGAGAGGTALTSGCSCRMAAGAASGEARSRGALWLALGAGALVARQRRRAGSGARPGPGAPGEPATRP